MKPVLVVHPSDEGYGADRVLAAMAEGCLARGRRLKVLLSDDTPPGWLSGRLAELGVPVLRAPLAPARRRYLTLPGLPRYLLQLGRARRVIRREARELGAGIVHVNTTALLAGGLVGRPGGARLVWHVHEIVRRPKALALLFRTLPALADVAVVVSRAVAANLTPPARRRARLVYNGLEWRDARPKDPAHPLALYAGRLSAWKGYQEFLAAALLLAPELPGVRFAFAGLPLPGEEHRLIAMREQIERAGLEERIALLGFVDDPHELYDQAAVVVVPSIWPDPLPTVVLEAMRAGCAVVATDHGGAPEMIVDGESGLLVPPGDVEALAGALRQLLSDPVRTARLGRNGRERVLGSFRLEQFQEEIELLYKELGA